MTRWPDHTSETGVLNNQNQAPSSQQGPSAPRLPSTGADGPPAGKPAAPPDGRVSKISLSATSGSCRAIMARRAIEGGHHRGCALAALVKRQEAAKTTRQASAIGGYWQWAARYVHTTVRYLAPACVMASASLSRLQTTNRCSTNSPRAETARCSSFSNRVTNTSTRP